jgi:thiamine kinase-like enzyme
MNLPSVLRMNRATAVPAVARPLLDRHFGAEWRDRVVEAVAGTANFVCRLEIGGRRFALRVPRVADTVTGVDRSSEFAALRAAAQAGLAPEIFDSDEASGVLITHWIEGGYWSREHAHQPAAIRAVAGAFRQLHGIVPAERVRQVRVAAVIDHYLGVLRAIASESADRCRALHARARDSVERTRGWTEVLCHNDVHYLNIIETPGGLRLLDWEYAGLGAAMFDLAGYASYQELQPDDSALLLQSYGAGEAGASTFADWRWLFEYVWALWLAATQSDPRTLDRLLARLDS